MVNLRRATVEDVPMIVDLVEELDRFYGASDFDDVTIRRRDVTRRLFGTTPAAYVILAEKDGRTIGFASYSPLWPAEGVTASVYLKELFVSASHRRKGVGRQLIGTLCAVAFEGGYSRVEWTTDRVNLDAQRFYDNIGAEVLQSKLMYRVDCALLGQLAEI